MSYEIPTKCEVKFHSMLWNWQGYDIYVLQGYATEIVLLLTVRVKHASPLNGSSLADTEFRNTIDEGKMEIARMRWRLEIDDKARQAKRSALNNLSYSQ